MVALLWLIAGVVLVAAEVISGDLVLLMLGVAALGAAGAAALGAPLAVDAAVFAALSLGLVLLARPALKRRLMRGADLRTNAEALIGKKALVEATVDSAGGLVLIDGQSWSARPLGEDEVIRAGETVTVMDISGATAVVSGEF